MRTRRRYVPGQESFSLEQRLPLDGDMGDIIVNVDEDAPTKIEIEVGPDPDTQDIYTLETIDGVDINKLDIDPPPPGEDYVAISQFQQQMMDENLNTLQESIRQAYDNTINAQAGAQAALLGSSVTGYYGDPNPDTDPDPMITPAYAPDKP